MIRVPMDTPHPGCISPDLRRRLHHLPYATYENTGEAMTREEAVKQMCAETDTQDLAFMLSNPMMKQDLRDRAKVELELRGISAKAILEIIASHRSTT